MGFTSSILPDELILNDETPDEIWDIESEDMQRGLTLEMRGPGDFVYDGYASPFDSSLLIPESEWEERIKEMEEQKTRLIDICSQAGLPAKNQERTNYCWIYSPCYAMEVGMVTANQPVVNLSPASSGARIKGFRNVGGWGREAVAFIAENGVNTVQQWPSNQIDRRFLTRENIEAAKRFRIAEWMELRPRSVAQMMSMLLRRIPLTGGYNWWRHQVTSIDPLWLDGAPAVRIRNSWGNWGQRGYGILQGSKMLADDIIALVSVRPFTL